MPVFRASAMLAVAAVASLALTSCASRSPLQCATVDHRPVAEVVFGRVSEGAPGVSEVEFAKFMREEVNPRFHDGLTVVDAQDLWPSPAGSAIHGPSKTVMIVLRGTDDEMTKLDAVRAAYTRRYRQKSVLVMNSTGCA